MSVLNNKVYLIDDDELVLATLKNVLFCAGYTVSTYCSAQFFLQQLANIDDGCIIVDLRMPEIDGLQLQQRLIANNIHLPIIFLSGAADINSAVEAMAAGAVTFLQKPVANADLVRTVAAALEKHQQKTARLAPALQARKQLALLSERELKIATLSAAGLSAMDIAHQLYISNRTVEAHKASIFSKLEIKNITQLTRLVLLADYLTENK